MTHNHPIPRCLAAAGKWLASTLKGRDMERYVGSVKLTAQSCIEDHSIVIAHRWYEDAVVYIDSADAKDLLSGNHWFVCERQGGKRLGVRHGRDGGIYFRFDDAYTARIEPDQAHLFTGFIRSWA